MKNPDNTPKEGSGFGVGTVQFRESARLLLKFNEVSL